MRIGFASLAAILVLGGCDPFANQGSGETISLDTPLVVADGVAPTVLGEVAIGQPSLVASEMPTQFEAVDAEPNCRMPRPSRTAKVAYVYTYGGGIKTPLQYIADGDDMAQIAARIRRTKQLARQVAREGSFVQAALAREAAGFAKGNTVEWAKRIDVLVTETDAPVFLVLTSYNAVLWNIQKAPGVTIDGIIVSAYEGGAIANGVDKRRTGFMGFDGAPNRSCRWKGHGRPVPVQVRIAGATELNPEFDASGYRDQWQQEYRDNQMYFAQTLPRKIGKKPTWLLNNARGGSFQAVLVGPAPATPFQQQTVTRLQIPSYIEPFWGTRQAAFKYFGLE